MIVSRGTTEDTADTWPQPPSDPFAEHAEQALLAPWRIDTPLALGASIEAAAGIWDGVRLSLIAAQTNWGRLGFDA